MNEALQALEDSRFTGNALEDFGLSVEDTQMDGLHEDAVGLSAPDDVSMQSSNTQAATVKMANLKQEELQEQPLPLSSNASSTDETDVSSLDDDQTGKSFDATYTARIMILVGIIFMGMSFILGGILLWLMIPLFHSSPSVGQQHDRNEFKGTIGFSPTVSPNPINTVPYPNTEPSDLFSDTGGPLLDCPTPLPQAPPLPGKKGIVLDLDEYDRLHLGKVAEINPYWNYSKGPRLARNQPEHIEYIPMIPSANDYSETSETVVNLMLSDSDHRRVMGYYEPDDPNGPNTMSVDAALNRWQLLEELYVPLVSPAAVDATGNWMREFMSKAQEKCLRIDWIAVQWFGGKSFHNFKMRMEDIYTMYGQRPLLISEFSTVDWGATERGFNRFTEKDVLDFMKQAIPWLEEQEWIAGYAWHNFATNHTAGGPAALFDMNGGLTTVGQFYASVRTDNPEGNQNISL